MNKTLTCCFTGHRKLPKDKIEIILMCLEREVERLITQGVTNFISGGALGFDQMAAALIVAKREMGNDVRLIFALPCRDQDALWSERQKKLYQQLLNEADEIVYVADKYYDGCLKQRNRYMVDHAGHCLCAMLRSPSGTAQTLNYAREKHLHIINVAE